MMLVVYQNLFQRSLTVAILLLHAAIVSAAQPNILYIVMDDWGQHASCYGTPWIKTPNIDQLAKQGILFKNAFTPNAKCAPSRAMMLTGRQTWQLEEACNHMPYFPAKFKLFTEVLQERGYNVASTGKVWGPGSATTADGKDRAMCGKPYNERKTQPPAKGIGANDYAGNFETFLSATPQGQPWFFWCGPAEPHRNYEAGSAVRAGKSIASIDRVPAYWPDNETVRLDMLDYALEVEYVDQHIGSIVKQLQAKNLFENTLIVVSSDHGMPFPRVKGDNYLHSNQVPMIACWPQGIRNPGRTIEDFVDMTDLAPTFLDVAQIDGVALGMSPITGSSWRPIFDSSQSGQVLAHRDHVLIGRERHDAGRPNDEGYPVRGMIKNGYLAIRNYKTDRWPTCNPETGYLNCDGSPTKTLVLAERRKNPSYPFWATCFGKRVAEELYDLTQDPDCVVNLATRSEHQDRLKMMLDDMTEKLTKQQDPRVLGMGDVFDRYTIATQDSRGFYDRYLRGEKPKAGWVSATDAEPAPISLEP
jgi:N-sulfoglucosamine sulfohydrolase